MANPLDCGNCRFDLFEDPLRHIELSGTYSASQKRERGRRETGIAGRSGPDGAGLACRVNDHPLLHDDVWPALEQLRARGMQIAILTNGPSDGQRRKLKATGLHEAVDHIAIGEETGFSKPLAAAFHAVLDCFSLDSRQALMVGDSPELDYDGAIGAGLRALLLDRDGSRTVPHRQSIRSLIDIDPHAG